MQKTFDILQTRIQVKHITPKK